MSNRMKIWIGLAGIMMTVIPARSQGKQWTLEQCIQFALEKNIEAQKADLNSSKSDLYVVQAKASRLPSVSASARHNLNWQKSYIDTLGQFSSLENSNSTTLGVSSTLNIYHGNKTNYLIRQSKLDLESSIAYAQSVKESVSINILKAYIQLLYAKEQRNNAENQVEATTRQLELAHDRLLLGAISQSDYLQIKSELASEKLTLANTQSDFWMARIDLMQLMELPLSDEFDIAPLASGDKINLNIQPDAKTIYQQALSIKPGVKSAELSTQSASYSEKIAKADYYPSLSLNAGINSTYSGSHTPYNFSEQLNNSINPTLGLTLAIPIFQNKQVKTSVGVAKINTYQAQLDELNTKNQLRKEIEQASTDVISAQIQYEAGLEQFNAVRESYMVAIEKYNIGMMNSVDFLFEKNNLISAETQVTQARYNLIFAYKMLDFYKGQPLTIQ